MSSAARRSARLSAQAIQVVRPFQNNSSMAQKRQRTVSEGEDDSDLAIRPKVKRNRVDHDSNMHGKSLASPSASVPAPEQHSILKSSNRRKKPIEEPNPENYPARVANEWKIGAHVSAAGGVENVIQNAAAVGANSFALFLKSQRKWSSPDLKEDSIKLFKSRLSTFGYSPSHILPHGSYLINLGNPDSAKREKSYECFLDDLRRCEQLGLLLYNFHPGSTVGSATTEESISHIAACLNRAHKATNNVVTVIENMAGTGNIIGSSFSEISSIIRQVEDKSRVGVCLDTCHMFAAGYDIRTKDQYESSMLAFDEQVGLAYLRGMHLNDSKMPHNSKKDRHENIGLGKIGLSPFSYIVTDARLKGIPLILETPIFESPNIWKKEIETLNRLSALLPEEQHDSLQDFVDEVEHAVKQANGIHKRRATDEGSKKMKKGKLKPDVSDEDMNSEAN